MEEGSARWWIGGACSQRDSAESRDGRGTTGRRSGPTATESRVVHESQELSHMRVSSGQTERTVA